MKKSTPAKQLRIGSLGRPGDQWFRRTDPWNYAIRRIGISNAIFPSEPPLYHRGPRRSTDLVRVPRALEPLETPFEPMQAVTSLSLATQSTSYQPNCTDLSHRVQTAGFSGQHLTTHWLESLTDESPNYTSVSSPHSIR